MRVEGSTAYVLFKRSSACGKCGACGMLKDMSEIEVDVENTLDAREDDRVSVEFSVGNALKASLIAYIFPLIMLIVGVFVGYNLAIPGWLPDVSAAVFGLGLTALSYLVIRLFEPKLKKRLAGNFRMISVEDSEA